MTDVAMADDFSLPSSSFVPNGLLRETPRVHHDLLAGVDDVIAADEPEKAIQSQDKSLPSLSQLFPSRLNESSTSKSSLSPGVPADSAFVHPSSSAFSLPRVPIKATSFDGKVVFLPRKKNTWTRIAPGRLFEDLGTMLEVPTHRLAEQLSATAAVQSVHARDQAVHTHNKFHSTCSDKELWVDRYRPKRFLDLLGDERMHRETLAWVKEWDFCVFGKKRPRGKQRAVGNAADLGYKYEDEYHRPREKILLLSGPPGLGKTTLAHVVAAQAGYKPMEINASDARSGQVIDERIRPALESGAAVGSKTPILLVVDEIDGATGGGDHTSSFVQKLLQLTFDKPKRKGRTSESRSRPLLRPIIAICNDLYASSLAKLRQHARIVRFNRPADIHLVKRLRYICEVENMRADSRALSALVGIAQGDMRGCLNTLQFIKSRNQEVTEPIIRAATVGMKEVDTSFLSVLCDLFSPLSKRRARELGLTEADEARYVSRLTRDAEGSGSLDKLSMGCFEHYLNLHVHDVTFQRYENAHEWLSAFDVLSGMMRSEKEYALMPYLPYPLVAFYPLFAERGGPRPERPKADWENFVRTKASQDICDTISKGGVPGQGSGTKTIFDHRHLTKGDVLKLEFLPLLNRIISPPLRPVNSHFIRPEERALMKRLVNIMVSLELRFVQEKTEDGALVYRLDPPIDVFVTYDGKRAPDIAVPRYAVRHLVAAEIDAELILRQAEAVEKVQTNIFKRRTEDVTEGESSGTHTAHGKLVGRGVPQQNSMPEEKDKPAVDFFGRPINLPVINSSGKTAHVEPAAKQCKVMYRFKEGNSSAVRKPVRIEVLL